MNIRDSLWSKLLFPDIITFIPETENKIFLTFDDGPTPGITNQVLAFLSHYEAKATFFCIGRNAEQHKELIYQTLDQGHRIGNHGYSHLNGWTTSSSVYCNDCWKSAGILNDRIFRPPYGKITPGQYNLLKKEFTIYLWTALSWDFHLWVSKEQCLKYTAKNLFPGAILVFHDTVKASQKLLFTLPRLLEMGKEKGYDFSVLPVK